MGKSKKEETTKKDVNQSQSIPMNGFWGLGMAFVLVSIVYSTYVVATGTSGIMYIAPLIPQAIFAAAILLYKFVK
jgi:hypothetical protein